MVRRFILVILALALAAAAQQQETGDGSRSRSSLLGPLFKDVPPAPPRAQASQQQQAKKATLVFDSINVRNNHKIVRNPLVTLFVAVDNQQPLRVELPKATSDGMEYNCAKSGAVLPSTCDVGDIGPGSSITVRVLESNGNVTLMQPRQCRFFADDLLPNLAQGIKSADSNGNGTQVCSSGDIRALRFNCRDCTPGSPPDVFATLKSIQLTDRARQGTIALACNAPSSGPFLLALPRVTDARREYSCADSGASSCRLAKLAPGERISCAVVDPHKVDKPAAALLQASACRPTVEQLGNTAQPQECTSKGVRLQLGCDGC